MSLLLFFYNLLFPLVFLCILPGYLPRMFRRGGYKNRFLQRLGIFDHSTVTRVGKGRLWVHAVSVGEVLIALKFIRCFKKRHPEARFLLSTTTTTALEIADKEASDWLEPIANPLDFFFISRFLFARFEPSALITVEGDLWPQRLFDAKKRCIPTALISARLSKRSESRFRQFRYFIAPIFNALDLMCYPSVQDSERWRALGIHPAESSVTGNSKFDQEGVAPVLPPADLSNVLASLRWGANDPIFLAGSTCHLAEEEIVLNAWLSLRKRFPDLRLILAPRHAERRHEIRTLLQKHQLTVMLRSEKNTNITSTDVFLLDTTGELQSWYLAATVIFIGKSLGVENTRGGHNPVEPLVLGRPVLVGPYMDNFQPLVAQLLSARGILEVKSAQEITLVTERLLLAPEDAAVVVERGMHVLQQDQGANERTCVVIEKLLQRKNIELFDR